MAYVEGFFGDVGNEHDIRLAVLLMVEVVEIAVCRNLRRLVHEYPNVFLNTFCTRSGQIRAQELIEAERVARIYEEEAVWKDIIRTNILFNFVQQLKHIGILGTETRSHSGAISEYDSTCIHLDEGRSSVGGRSGRSFHRRCFGVNHS